MSSLDPQVPRLDPLALWLELEVDVVEEAITEEEGVGDEGYSLGGVRLGLRACVTVPPVPHTSIEGVLESEGGRGVREGWR